jgi:hypothetical protein
MGLDLYDFQQICDPCFVVQLELFIIVSRNLFVVFTCICFFFQETCCLNYRSGNIGSSYALFSSQFHVCL